MHCLSHKSLSTLRGPFLNWLNTDLIYYGLVPSTYSLQKLFQSVCYPFHLR